MQARAGHFSGSPLGWLQVSYAADMIQIHTDTGLLVCSQKAKIQNKYKTQVKYSAKKVWQQGRIVSSSGFTRLKNAATVQNIKT